MADVRLSSPRLTVIRTGEEPVTLQTNNLDMVLWDRTRVKHKWPRLDDAPFLWFTFISWSAAKRTGLIEPTTTYESWESTVLDINAQDDDDETADIGRPTFGVVERA